MSESCSLPKKSPPNIPDKIEAVERKLKCMSISKETLTNPQEKYWMKVKQEILEILHRGLSDIRTGISKIEDFDISSEFLQETTPEIKMMCKCLSPKDNDKPIEWLPTASPEVKYPPIKPMHDDSFTMKYIVPKPKKFSPMPMEPLISSEPRF